ncbi:hypothetical protein [Streptomyces sp. KR80]
MDRTTAAVLYENGTNNPYERITFERFTLTCPGESRRPGPSP